MSIKLRKETLDPVMLALVDQHNALRDAMVGTNFHASTTAGGPPTGDPPTVTALTTALPTATSAATSIALVNDLLRIVNEHFPDTHAHKTAVSASLALTLKVDTTLSAGAQLTAGIAAGNAIKAAYNTHLAAANVHFTNDGTNTIAATDATDQTSLNTLLNEMRTDIPAHIASALAGQHIQLIEP